jgi:Lrp/AsnC family leucine-responsive transcriptional regulator
MSLDQTDRKILRLLQANARVTNAEVAREVGMAPSATFERLRKLEERGVIAGYETRVDAEQVGLGLTAFILVKSTEGPGSERTGDRLAAIDEVQEVHHIAGEDCFILKVRARDPRDLQRVLRERIGRIPEVASTRTTIVLQTVKETLRMPIEPA